MELSLTLYSGTTTDYFAYRTTSYNNLFFVSNIFYGLWETKAVQSLALVNASLYCAASILWVCWWYKLWLSGYLVPLLNIYTENSWFILKALIGLTNCCLKCDRVSILQAMPVLPISNSLALVELSPRTWPKHYASQS